MEHICTVAQLEKKCVNLGSFHPALFSSQRKSPVKYYSEKESLSNMGNDSAFKAASTCPKSRETLKTQHESVLKH